MTNQKSGLFARRNALLVESLNAASDAEWFSIHGRILDIEEEIIGLRTSNINVILEQIQIWNRIICDAKGLDGEDYAEDFQTFHDNIMDALDWISTPTPSAEGGKLPPPSNQDGTTRPAMNGDAGG